MAVHHPVAIGVLDDIDRRQDREAILRLPESLPACRPVAATKLPERQEVTTALIATANGGPRDLLDIDRPCPDLDRSRPAGVRVLVIEVRERSRTHPPNPSDASARSLVPGPLDVVDRLANPVDDRLGGGRDAIGRGASRHSGWR